MEKNQKETPSSDNKTTKSDTDTSTSNNNNNVEEYSIFVGGLSSRCTKRDLFEYFKKFGNIQSCEPQMWKKSNMRCRGFALIRCGDKQTYEAILKTRRHYFQNRNIECKKCFKSKDKLNEYNRKLIQRKLFVGGIPPSATTRDLERLFNEIGEIDIAYIITHHRTGRSKGFGYVCFKEKSARDRALAIKDFELFGKVVSCSEYSHKFLFKNEQQEQQQRREDGRRRGGFGRDECYNSNNRKAQFMNKRRKRFKSQKMFNQARKKPRELEGQKAAVESYTASQSPQDGKEGLKFRGNLATTDCSSSVSGQESRVKLARFHQKLGCFEDWGYTNSPNDANGSPLDKSLHFFNLDFMREDEAQGPQSSDFVGKVVNNNSEDARNGFSLFGSLDGRELCKKFGFSA